MKENEKKGISRREFLGLSALGLASFTILPSWSINGIRIAPSDRVVLGFIGLGQQGLSDFTSFSNCPGVQVAAGCDVDSMKRERFARRIMAWQKKPLACSGHDPCLPGGKRCILPETVSLYDSRRFGDGKSGA